MTPAGRRLASAGAGIGVGSAAWGLSEALMLDVSVARDSILREVYGGGGALPWFAWVGFFLALFGLRRWWRHADGYRPKRLRIRTVLTTFLVGAAATAAFGLPAELGLTWAVGISVVSQLAAVWTPPRKRPRKVPVV